MRSLRPLFVGLLGVMALAGCGAGAATVAPVAAPAPRSVQVSETFGTAPGVAVTYDQKLVEAGSRGAVSSESAGGTTTVKLAVRGLEPERRYGAHAHTRPCGAKGADAGPHYQNTVDPVTPSVDPQYANPQNEIWLDFTTDATGAASVETAVAWQFPADRRARSVIVHAMPTATEHGMAGTAGDRAACITVDF